jgi:hypothetical protein
MRYVITYYKYRNYINRYISYIYKIALLYYNFLLDTQSSFF